VVLYELLVGAPPFSGDSPVSVAYKHVSEPPQPLRERNPQVPEQLEAVCMRSLAKNPANRYPSADEMAADIRRFRAGQAVHAEALLPGELTTAVPIAEGTTRAVPSVSARTQVVDRVAEPRYTTEPPRRSPAFLVLLVLLLGGVAALVGFLAANLHLGASDTAKQVTVQKVVGFEQADAERRLEASGLKVRTVVEANAAAEGTVFSQNPEAGKLVDAGSTVEIHVASARPPVEVPDVVGKTRDVADQLMRAKNLVAKFTLEENDQVPADTVIRQTPKGAEKVSPDSEVQVVLSAGKGKAEVPNLRGHPAATAANELGRAGFVVGTTQMRAAGDVGAGDVIETNPPAGTVLDKGSTVTIVVSSGPATTTTTLPTTTTTKKP
jgi:serine/threonine-protein kinase